MTRYDDDGYVALGTLLDITEKHSDDTPAMTVSRRVHAWLRYSHARQTLNVAWTATAGTGHLWHHAEDGQQDIGSVGEAKSVAEQRVSEAIERMSRRLLAGESVVA